MLNGLEKKEKILIGFIVAMGFFFSSREFLLWLNGLNPLTGLVYWYGFFFITSYILLKGMNINFGTFTIPSWGMKENLGFVMLLFAFFMVTSWGESCLTSYYVKGNCEGIPMVYIQSEDGAMFYLWQTRFPELSIEIYRILTYVLTPFLLSLVGALLMTRRI